MDTMLIHALTDMDKIPWELLLQADPSREKIRQYLKKGFCFIMQSNNKIIGTYVLQKLNSNAIELKNISVSTEFQNQGIGKKLILNAIENAKALGMKRIDVGTGNSSIFQIAFYQKCGFHISRIKKNFFVQNYPDEIYENGIQCTDMIIFSKSLI